MSTTTLTKRGGVLVLEGMGDASLDTGGGMTRGKITVNGEKLPVHVTDRRRLGVQVEGGKAPLVRLDPGGESLVPGSARPATWDVSRTKRTYHATLTRGGDRIEFSLGRGKAVEVSVTGNWEQLELVALAGCFSLLSRKRGDKFRAAVIATATGPSGN